MTKATTTRSNSLGLLDVQICIFDSIFSGEIEKKKVKEKAEAEAACCTIKFSYISDIHNLLGYPLSVVRCPFSISFSLCSAFDILLLP